MLSHVIQNRLSVSVLVANRFGMLHARDQVYVDNLMKPFIALCCLRSESLPDATVPCFCCLLRRMSRRVRHGTESCRTRPTSLPILPTAATKAQLRRSSESQATNATFPSFVLILQSIYPSPTELKPLLQHVHLRDCTIYSNTSSSQS